MPGANDLLGFDTFVSGVELDASVRIRSIAATELDEVVPELAQCLIDLVESGFPLGFLAPLSRVAAERYWSSLRAEIESGSRVLLVASIDDRIISSGQLAFPRWPNARHRAEVNKVFAIGDVRGRGVGLCMMHALHHAARQRGRSLLLLSTRQGGYAEGFYRKLGYRVIGTTPGYYMDAAGKPADNVSLYIDLSRLARRDAAALRNP